MIYSEEEAEIGVNIRNLQQQCGYHHFDFRIQYDEQYDKYSVEIFRVGDLKTPVKSYTGGSEHLNCLLLQAIQFLQV